MSQSSSPARCKNPGGDSAAGSLPWASHPRGGDKTAILRIACENPGGVPLVRLAQLIADGPAGEYNNADYQLVRRFTRDSDLFRTENRDGKITYKGSVVAEYGRSLWIEPRPSAFTCYRSKHHPRKPPKPPASAGVTRPDGCKRSPAGSSSSPSDGAVAESPTRSPPSPPGRPTYAKDRARAYLNSHNQISADSVRRSLLSELSRELGSIEGKVTVLECDVDRPDLPEYLLVPYATRFNDPSRASRSRQNFDAAWEQASKEHSSAVVATITTDPSMHESATAATEALRSGVSDLRGWLSRDVSAAWAPRRVGRRLPYLSVLEFTDSGLAHAHVVFFGVRSLCSQQALSAYMSDRTGRITYLQTLTSRSPGGRWRWANQDDRPEDADRGVSPQAYLSKHIRDQQRLAGMDVAEVREAIDSGDLSLWKQALYWALGKQHWTASAGLQGLTETSSGSEHRLIDRRLPPIPAYRFVGAARLEDLPGHVLSEGVVLGRGTGTGTGPPRPPPSQPPDSAE